MERPKFVDHPDPNIVVRGAPLDGGRARVHNRQPVAFDADGQQCVYRPSGELDREYPTLNVYVFDHIEQA